MQVTIGICAHNEEKNIGKLLKNLINEDFEFDLKEIMVVASGCTDRTEEIVRKLEKENKKVKLIVEKKRKGKASAVNLILKKAKGNIIVFVCADNLPEKGCVNRIVNEFHDTSIGGVSGRPLPLSDSNSLVGYAWNLIWELHHEVCKFNPKLSGEFCAVRKNILKALPKKIINDDGYLAAIIKKMGFKIIYCQDAISYITEKITLSSYLKKRRRIARGYIQLRNMKLDVSIWPLTILKLVIKKIIKNPSKILQISFAVMLEIIANVLAYWDCLVGNLPYCWEK
jgi:cellulose synthase/poly-beta-1,6-N-acetylglucosamine synthase-like glycosyltransferase